MKKIFISAIGGDIGHGIIKALKKSNHSLYLIGCDVIKYNAAYDLVDTFFISPPYKNEAEWLQFILTIIKEQHVDYFWPVTEPEIKLVDKNRDLFSNVSIVINHSNILDIALDKGKTAEFLTSGGILTPRTWTDAAACTENTYPLIAKEKFGCGSHSVYLLRNEADRSKALSSMQDPIIQEYIGEESEEYTLTVFSDGNIVNHIAFKRMLGLGGMSRYVELVQNDALEEIANNIAALFALKGSINVQMRKSEGKYYVFEINPRISSTIGFRIHLGFNDAAWWLDLLEGSPVAQYHCPFQKAHGVRTVEEKLFYE